MTTPTRNPLTHATRSLTRGIAFMAVLLLTCFQVAADDFSDAGHPAGSCANREGAEEFLSTLPLIPIEGIWEYPADEVALMVVREPMIKGRFGIFLVESVDCRLYPGMRLGWIEESPKSGKFRISLSSRLRNGIPAGHIEGVATLADGNESLLIEMPQVKLSLSPSLLLPTLWNRLRLAVRLKVKDPLEQLPQGWIRTFPSYDLNGSRRNHPRYL